jgi:hypothetical protein
MKLTVKQLKDLVSKQFERQAPMLNLWQTLAEHFYPERADFTYVRNQGAELADNLLNSYPLLMRRDLGNSLSSMLRDGDWFSVTTGSHVDPGHAGQKWLDWASKKLRKIMYDRSANFVKATKQGDHDYVTFGQPVMSVERARNYNGLLYRTWHLKDCAWWEDETGEVCGVARKWKPTLMQAITYFGEQNLDPRMVKNKNKPNVLMGDVELYHIHMRTEEYLGEPGRRKYVSIWLDPKYDHIVEELEMDNKHYTVPRFQTIAGSAYSYSMATVVALPDARMLQAMTHTLMEAGERYVRPPLIGAAKAIPDSIDLSPDGVTWADDEFYDKTGSRRALEPLYQDRGGFPIGLELRQGIMDVLADAFFINKINLPDIDKEMTAYEVSERMKQYRRENLPLFSPIEHEYNGSLCEMSFDLAFGMGLLGSPYDVPEELQGHEVEFKFESPLSESEEEKKMNRFQQVSQALADAAQIDQSVRHNVNFDEAFRDAVTGMGAPEKWLNPIEMVAEKKDAELEMQAAQAEAAA